MVTIAPVRPSASTCTAEVGRPGAQVSPSPGRSSTARCREYLKYLSYQVSARVVSALDLGCRKVAVLRVARQLRQDDRHADTPVVMFSSSANLRDVKAAKRCGADDYYAKPFVADGPFRVIERFAICWLPHTR